ncbi:hypothetical protein [Ornithinimicrobium flavum]|uniref:hypothetical protein n=1 Tax=Ornithinimicrobium flavum TaxID=1288636 RepID=UPI0010704819|nr:hypothetical protein [Ornithinimicrobium flavum]
MSSSVARRLVVAYCFVPYVDTSGTVAAKRVCLRGEPVDVIQNEMSGLRAIDPGLDRVADGQVRRRAVLDTPTYFSSWRSIVAWCEEGMQVVDRWTDESARTGDLLGHGVPWSSMFSRSHFVASHFLAALVKAEHPDIVWEAEFSDPCSADATGAERYAPMHDSPLRDRFTSLLREAGWEPPAGDNVYEWAEVLVYALADEILFTNAQQADYMAGRCADPRLADRLRRHTVAAHHPMLPEKFYAMDRAPVELEEGVLHIAYFGNFYGKQSPVAAVEAMAQLPAEQRARLRLHLFTQPTATLRGVVEEMGLQGVVLVEEFLPFLQFLEIARRMDLLLVVDYPLPQGAERNPFLLSKWGDYRGSGTPVWGILEESSVLSATDDPALQYRTPVGHATAAAQLLSQLARGVRAPDREAARPGTARTA